MDIPSTSWLPELEMDEPQIFVNQHQQTCPNYSNSTNSFSSESFKDYQNLVNQSIQETTINGDMSNLQDYNIMKTSRFAPSVHGSSSNSFNISFGNLSQTNPGQPHEGSKLKYSNNVRANYENMGRLDEFDGSMDIPQRVSSTSRNHIQAQEHVFAERKRREKLSQRFISLYALLPQLKKMDKATVLEDASKYIKELQNRVKELERIQDKGKHIIQKTTVSVEKSNKLCRSLGVDASSSKSTKTLHSSSQDPEIVVRISGANILVRIYCQRNLSLVLKTVNELERLQFVVISSSVLPSSKTDLLITITAQMSDELLMTAMDLVKSLQSALRNFV